MMRKKGLIKHMKGLKNKNDYYLCKNDLQILEKEIIRVDNIEHICIYYLMLHGLKASEIINLKTTDIYCDENTSYVYANNRKVILDYTKHHYFQELLVIRSSIKTDENILLTSSRIHANSRQLSPSAVSKIIIKYGNLANVHVTPKRLRSTAIINTILDGWPTYVLNTLYGQLSKGYLLKLKTFAKEIEEAQQY